MSTHTPFHAWLKQRRKFLDLTQQELAERVGCAVETIRKLEQGQRRPSKEIAHRLIQSLEVPLEQRTSFLHWARTQSVIDAYSLRSAATTQQNATPWTSLLTGFNPAVADKKMRQLPIHVVPVPAPLPAGSRMPLSHNPLFIGRDTELRTLAGIVGTGDTAVIGQLIAVTGLGGIGKTQLATEFVHRYGQYFPGGVFWLNFADPAAVPAEIAACGGLDGMRLSPNFSTLPFDDQVRLVLAEWRSSLPRLLVFDNCEDEALLDQWRPKTGGCRVLITSRRAAWDRAFGVHPLRLGVLPRAESIALLRAFRSDVAEDDAMLAAIAAALGDLPLALHLAGSFLKRYQLDMTITEYLDELRAATGIAHESLEGASISPTHHDLSVARTFRLSYDRLDGNSAIDTLALGLLARAAYFAPGEPIPRDLLRATVALPSDDRSAKRQVTYGIRRLVDLGLLEEEAEGAVRMHRLVAAFVQAVAWDTTAQTAVEQMLLDRATALNDQGYPGSLLALQPHLRTITTAALERQDADAAALGHALAYHLDMIGAYGEAQRYYEQALAIKERVLGPDHPATAQSLNNLGKVLRDQGQYQEAQRYFEQALAVRQHVLGSDHPDTAQSLNGLGGVCYMQGQYQQAQRYFEQALAIQQHVLGSDHPDTALSLNNLGKVLNAQGQYREAQRYYEQALAIWQQVLGPDHPDTALGLNNLGFVLSNQGQDQQARDYLEQALVIYQRVLGPDHPNTAWSLSNLGKLFNDQGRDQQARDYLEQALAIQERVLEKNHPDTAQSLTYLVHNLTRL